MDYTLFPVVTATAVLLSLVVLGVMCLHCRHKRPLVYIRQEHTSQSSAWEVFHPSQPHYLSFIHNHNSTLLSPSSPFSEAGRNNRSTSPAESGSNPSYENSGDGSDSINGSDVDDPGYIIVLPEGEVPLANHSRASTPSSELLHNYENLPEKTEDQEYLNVDLPMADGSITKLSSNDDDDDEDEGNYVNMQDGMQEDQSWTDPGLDTT